MKASYLTLITCVIILSMQLVESSVFIDPRARHNSTHCRYDEHYIQKGTSLTIKPDCIHVACDNNFMLYGSGCGVIDVEPPCTLKVNTNLDYPYCCPEPDCPSDNSNSYETNQL